MTFKVLFLKELEIEPTLIESFSFTISMLNLLPESKILFKGLAIEVVSKIKRGTPIDIEFTEGQKTFKVPMKVVSYKRNPANKGSLFDKMQIVLAHEILFKDNLLTKAWGDDQQVISEMVPSILDKAYGQNYFNEIKLTLTEEKPAIRYQISENTPNFLHRLSKYAVKSDGPVYFYVDYYNNFNVIGFQEKIMASPKYELLPFFETADISNQKEIPQQTLKQIPVISYNLETNALVNNSIVNNVFSISNFRSTSAFNSNASFGGYELINGKVDSPTPSVTRFLPWYYTPSDAFALSAREFTESSLSSSYIAAYVEGFASNIPIGTKVQFMMPLEELKKSSSIDPSSILSETGQYMVFKMSFIFTGTETKTKLHLTDVTEVIE